MWRWLCGYVAMATVVKVQTCIIIRIAMAIVRVRGQNRWTKLISHIVRDRRSSSLITFVASVMIRRHHR